MELRVPTAPLCIPPPFVWYQLFSKDDSVAGGGGSANTVLDEQSEVSPLDKYSGVFTVCVGVCSLLLSLELQTADA